jgi:acyl-CoA reductase-like NAD-dependent aldehyde dehydrogenase
VRELLADSKKQGHRFALGPGDVETRAGFFLQPTIIDNPPEHARIVVEEQFGPVIPVLKWTDEDDVLARANDTVSGLGASVWGADRAKAEAIGRRIVAGTVWINSFAKTTPRALFGGLKESGVGGGEWGSTGMLSYCNVQVTHVFK